MIRNPRQGLSATRNRSAASAKPATNPDIVEYFAQRHSRLRIAKTTKMPSGQIIDWVPVESQIPTGRIPEPPPTADSQLLLPSSALRVAGFELLQDGAELGPPGTVPIPRKDFSRIAATTSLRRYLSKVGRNGRTGERVRSATVGDPVAPPAPDLSKYFHATCGESDKHFGCEALINIWTPFLENSSDHTIMQTGLQNFDRPQLQSLEAGWEISHDQYGDWSPHLFTYYTTNGYDHDGNNVGGYNQDVDGWCQVDAKISPAMRLLGTSTPGGAQIGVQIKYQLFQQNWWFQVDGVWIGFYPASLYLNPANPGTTLGDHADWLGFWGEVYTSEPDANTTTTWMGSGQLAERGFGQSCFQINLQKQIDAAGNMANLIGTNSAENSDYYNIVSTMNSGTSFGSFFFAGGPGDVPFEHRIVEVGTTFFPESDGTWLMYPWDAGDVPDLVFIKTANTPSGRVEIHAASGASKYQSRVFESATTFGNETDGTWLLTRWHQVHDPHRHQIPDLAFIKDANTPSGRVEVHIASGASSFRTRILEVPTTFVNEGDGTWLLADWDRDSIPDLVFIKTANTPSGRVEVHIASGKSNFQTRILEVATTFANEGDGTWLLADWDRDGLPDLVFIKTGNTGTGRVEVHIASGASNFANRIVERGTTFFPESDGFWCFLDCNRDGVPDLVFIKTGPNTGTGMVEVHIASGKQGG